MPRAHLAHALSGRLVTGPLPLQRTLLLPPEPASASAARRLVREVLTAVARDRWSEPAELAVTELVTNAVLHAHTDVGLTVAASATEVRVDVHDGSPLLPGQRAYDAQATTGRGMGLVGALSSEHGVTSLGDDGKVVWFVVDDRGQQQSDAALAAQFGGLTWDLDDLTDLDDVDLDGPDGVGEPATPAPVVLRALPPTLWLAARQHHDALLRELGLYLAEHDDVDVDLALADRARFTLSEAVDAAVEHARAMGTARDPLPAGHPSPLPRVPERLDLPLDLAQSAGQDFASLQDALDAAELLAEGSRLLVRPGLPEVVALRDWVCEQVQSQLHGVAPAPWPGSDQPRFETDVHARRHDPDWDVQDVLGSSRGVVAADDANRIVGISRPLAAALGWDPDDLVGRRVVALIPPSLREGHVAGFTRHLTTGEANVLGVPLTLPVLRRDGSEVTCTFLVEQGPPREGRALYLAWIEPVEQDSSA